MNILDTQEINAECLAGPSVSSSAVLKDTSLINPIPKSWLKSDRIKDNKLTFGSLANLPVPSLVVGLTTSTEHVLRIPSTTEIKTSPQKYVFIFIYSEPSFQK